MERKKKLRIVQLSLLLIGSLVIFFSYSYEKFSERGKIIEIEKQKILKKKIKDNIPGDVFYNIEYSGLDLSGNRFILKSKEANTTENKELVDLKKVEAIFYFKDDTILNVWSDFGVYNNKSLDIIFKKNVKAIYEESRLFSENASFSNSQNALTISDNVRVIDKKGTLNADKLFFDINLKTLNIETFNDNKINANLNVK